MAVAFAAPATTVPVAAGVAVTVSVATGVTVVVTVDVAVRVGVVALASGCAPPSPPPLAMAMTARPRPRSIATGTAKSMILRPRLLPPPFGSKMDTLPVSLPAGPTFFSILSLNRRSIVPQNPLKLTLVRPVRPPPGRSLCVCPLQQRCGL